MMTGSELLKTRDELLSLVLDEGRSLSEADLATVFVRYHEAIAKDRAEVLVALAAGAPDEKAHEAGLALVHVLISEAQTSAADAGLSVDDNVLSQAVRQAFARRLLEISQSSTAEGKA